MSQSLKGILLLDQDKSLGLTDSGINSLVETVTKETEDGLEVGNNIHWVWGQNDGMLC